MVLIHKHNLTRKVYVGGNIHPALMVASQAGTALLPHIIGKSMTKKIIRGILTGVGTALLGKALQYGQQYMPHTISHKINANNTLHSTIQRLLAISPGELPIIAGDPQGVRAIDNEMVPIKNQLMAQSASLDATHAPIRELANDVQKISMMDNRVPGYGMKKYKPPTTKGHGVYNKNVNNALNKRSDLLLKNILS